MNKETLMKILEWLALERTGLSSECMAFTAAGIHINRGYYFPSDPADFNRCLVLLKHVPEVRNHFDDIANLSIEWAKLIAQWDDIEKTFIEEAGFNWCKSNSAPKTYELMNRIIFGVKQ